jgi:hypothetical protein
MALGNFVIQRREVVVVSAVSTFKRSWEDCTAKFYFKEAADKALSTMHKRDNEEYRVISR